MEYPQLCDGFKTGMDVQLGGSSLGKKTLTICGMIQEVTK